MFAREKPRGRVPGRPHDPADRRSRLSLERLDQRLVLSGSSATLALAPVDAMAVLRVTVVVPVVNPFGQASAMGDPAAAPAFAIRFNRPLDRAQPLGTDFRVEAIQADGSLTTMPGLDQGYREVATGATPTADTLLVAFTTAIDPGRYRLELVGGNHLTDLDGTGTGQLNQVIDEFTVAQAAALGGAPAAAQPLVGVTGAATTFVVPVVTTPQSQALVELDLPAGSHWQLTPQFGSADPDAYEVSLYDAQKQLILSTSGSRLAVLNQNLASGRCFVQFHRLGPGAADLDATLRVTVAGTPVEATLPHVLAITPTNANGLPGNPDSVLIQFDRSDLDPSLLNSAHSAWAMTDEAGLTWPITPSGFDPATSRLLLEFASDLPTGRYTIRATLPPASLGGMATTQVLGSFATTGQATTPGTLGTSYPGSTTDVWRNPTTLKPGESVRERFSVLADQDYRVSLSNPSVTGQLIQLSSSTSTAPMNQRIGSDLGGNEDLTPGVYEVIVTNPTAEAQSVAFSVAATVLSRESLLNSGVGQLPAGLTQMVLGGGSTGGTASQNFATGSITTPAGPAGPAIEARDPSRGSTQFSLEGTGSSGAFHLAAFNQVPLGSFARPGPSAEPSGSSTSLALGPVTSMYTIQLGALPRFQPTRGAQPTRTRGDAPTPGPAVALPAALPERTTVAATLTPTDPTTTHELATEAESTTPSATSATPTDSTDPARTAILRDLAIAQLADGEASILPNQLADLSSPVGILVASCVLYRRIKASRYGACLPDQDRVASLWHAGAGRLGRFRPRRHD